MTQQLNLNDYKQALADVYNNRSQTYDDSKFHIQICQRLLELAKINPGQHILDIATGTGHVAIKAAQIVGDQGKVIGIDIAPKMLDRARDKVAVSGLTNITLQLADAESLNFPANSFDRILCANTFPWIENKAAALSQWIRFLKPGGLIAIHTPADTAYIGYVVFHYVWERYGVSLAPTNRIGTIEDCRNLFANAGFEKIEIATEQHGSYISLDEAKATWDRVYSIPYPRQAKNAFAKISSVQLAQAKAEFTAELEARQTPQGIWNDITTWYILGCKPETGN